MTIPKTSDTHAAELALLAADLRARTDRTQVRDDHHRRVRHLAERRADDASAAHLRALYRAARVDGTRARIAATLQDSAEARGLRVAAVRRWNLRVGLILIAVFAAWSTTNVHAGFVSAFGLSPGAPGWWVAWLVEPALITIVGLVLTVRSVLRSSGGDTDWQASAIMWGALGTSILLSMGAGGWPATPDPTWTSLFAWVTGLLSAGVGHAIGAIGAAAVVHLASLVDVYAQHARPWDDAPSVDDLDIPPLSTVTAGLPEDSEEAPVEELEPAATPEEDVEPFADPWDALEPWDGPEEPSAAQFWDRIENDAPAINMDDVYAYMAAPENTQKGPARKTPAPGSPEFCAAVEEYAASARSGRPLSGRELCRRYGVSPDNRKWARKVIDAAKARE